MSLVPLVPSLWTLLLVLVLSIQSTLSQTAPPPSSLIVTFTILSNNAPWLPRFAGTVEQLGIPVTAGGVQYPATSLVLHGGQGGFDSDFYNDVWISSDLGITWTRINSGTAGSDSYTPAAFPGHTKDSKGRLYRAGGRLSSGEATNEVWLSTNGGVSWALRRPSSVANSFPPRTFPEMMVNSIDEVYIAAGLTGSRDLGPGLNDMYQSNDQGANWFKLSNLPFSAPPGRSSASLLQFSAPVLAGKSVVWYMGGYYRYESGANGYTNDVFISTDYGGTWQTITNNAPWQQRGNFNAEMTSAGVIVLSSGFNQYNVSNTFNDVWAAIRQWGLCAEDAPFSDRRWQMTLLDTNGFFYVIGGDEENPERTQRVPKNDVWRSAFSFNDPVALSRACNVPMPVCGIGLYCLPGAQTSVVNGRVNCPNTEACTSNRMSFTMLTATAQWSVRHSSGLQSTKARVIVGSVTYPIGSMVLYGGVGFYEGDGNAMLSDSWISSNGATWQSLSSTGLVGSAFSGHTSDSKGRLYQVAGERWGTPQGQYVHGEVFMTANYGVSWLRQVPSNPARALPARGFPDIYVDSQDRLFAIGGLDGVGGNGMTDVYMSINQGRDWVKQGDIPLPAGGRSSAALLIHKSVLLKTDIMTYIGGYSRISSTRADNYWNDVWVSSDSGRRWTRLTSAAPFAPRANYNAMVTSDGLLVVAGGFYRNGAHNDVWVSADGGYSWGECVAEAQFSDRRWEMTALDANGYVIVAGGEEFEGTNFRKQSDVWRSSISLSKASKYSLKLACPGLQFPSCVVGLSCWPGSSTSFRPNQAASCPAVLQCNIPQDEYEGSSGMSSSTGVAQTSDSGLSTGAMVLIGVIVVVVVVAIYAYFKYQKGQKQQTPSLDQGNTSLLEGTSTQS